MVFMGFFFLGYLAVLYLFINKIDFASSLFVAIIFFFGAVFVFLGIIIQKIMFSAINEQNRILKEYNDKIQGERDRLLALNQQLEVEISNRVKAEESDKMKSDFLSLVSHELRTPLTSIFGFTKLIEKGLSGLDTDSDKMSFKRKKERLDNNLGIVCDECSRLTRLINNVLDLTKIESGQVNWDDTPTSLGDIVQSSINAVEGLFVEKQAVEFIKDIPAELPRVCVDSDLFAQVLINLVSNAVKFTDEGQVKLSISLNNNAIHLIVSDTGRGIESEHLKDIFDKFYIVRSGDTLGAKQTGTGLGLPICKEIVEHYSGKIWVESTAGKGSSFHVMLPDSTICID